MNASLVCHMKHPCFKFMDRTRPAEAISDARLYLVSDVIEYWIVHPFCVGLNTDSPDRENPRRDVGFSPRGAGRAGNWGSLNGAWGGSRQLGVASGGAAEAQHPSDSYLI
jgi:hypothetical protein